MTGFVEPFRFSDSDRADLERMLGKHKAGDGEGRRLLIAATEYEIGLYLDEAVRHPRRKSKIEKARVSAGSTDADLQPIASAAVTLVDLLKASSEASQHRIKTSLSASDPLGRDYGDRFLSCLATELERLAESCRQTGEEEVPNPEPLPGFAQTFLHQMREIYTECLEIQPTAAADEPFYQYLNAISEIGGIGAFHTETVLRELLKPE